MAKCEKCGKEYPDGTKHVCSLPEEQKPETNTSEEKITPAEETQSPKTENSTS